MSPDPESHDYDPRLLYAAPQPSDEPVAWMHTNAVGHTYFRKHAQGTAFKPVPLYTAPQPAKPAEQEPVAWLYRDCYNILKLAQIEPPPPLAFPVYTAPQPRREVELTDEEIDALPWGPSYDNPMTLTEGLRDFARAVIEAYKAKQGEQT